MTSFKDRARRLQHQAGTSRFQDEVRITPVAISEIDMPIITTALKAEITLVARMDVKTRIPPSVIARLKQHGASSTDI